jgi:hypothetical protein
MADALVKWEYLTEAVPVSPLAQRGQEGWRLVSINSGIMFYERPVPSPPPIRTAAPVQAATTSAADTSALVYDNGIEGIGATLTGAVATPVAVDGYEFNKLGQRMLVKDDAQSPPGAANGVYALTQLQTATLPPVFTRADDYNAPEDACYTVVPVAEGVSNAGTSWLMAAPVAMMGEDPIVYTKNVAPLTKPQKIAKATAEKKAAADAAAAQAAALAEETAATAKAAKEAATAAAADAAKPPKPAASATA